jgi:predicted nucleic acid-binding protein
VIFIDTGAFLARYLSKDQNHSRALLAWQELAEKAVQCWTSSFVLDETFTLLGRRAGYAFAAQRARLLLTSRALSILRPDAEVELQSVAVMEKYADQQLSFTDCTSMVLMRKTGIIRAFTFDRHFQLAGFEVWPATS